MRIYIETYGCRMNICDSEVILSILQSNGHAYCADIHRADVIILNCCSVREVGHEKTFARLSELKHQGLDNKLIVLAGCFATQLDKSIFDRFPFVDIVIGPDSYRKLPAMLKAQERPNVIVKESSPAEMYADVVPLRVIEDKTTAAITVMKGCNQYCSYCIEPYTRGKESSRDMQSILEESQRIRKKGYKEITLVGHIIDRYAYGFAELLESVAESCPELRIKFLSSHPLTFTEEMAQVIRRNSNIMRVVHLPLQSGSDEVLHRMNRGYNINQFKEKVHLVRETVPGISIVTDIMTGFCGESNEDFEKTLEVIRELQFDDINAFCFSLRHGTKAAKSLHDDVPESVKQTRYREVCLLRDEIKFKKYSNDVGNTFTVFNEGRWYQNPNYFFGRDHNLRTVLFEGNDSIPINETLRIKITSVSAEYLFGAIV